MKNWIKYYYNIDIENIKKSNKEYIFDINKITYTLSVTDKSIDELKNIYDISIKLHQIGIPCHQIILNKENEIITKINEKSYILMKKYINSKDLITINDIIKFSKITTYNWNYPNIKRTNWKQMWVEKIDYFEYQLSQVGRHYPILVATFSYYEGITENAIQLIEMYNKLSNPNLSVAHKRINFNTTLEEFYNPLNFIIDYRIRDIAEYLKHKNNVIEIDLDVIEFLYKTFIITTEDKILFFIRILFPSFYFDIYEDILKDGIEQKSILYLNQNKIYEKLIKKIYTLTNSYINLPNIEWIY